MQLYIVLTVEEVSYLFDEVAELLVTLLHPLSALVGFDQHLLSVHLGLVCTDTGFPHLNTSRIIALPASILSYSTSVVKKIKGLAY